MTRGGLKDSLERLFAIGDEWAKRHPVDREALEKQLEHRPTDAECIEALNYYTLVPRWAVEHAIEVLDAMMPKLKVGPYRADSREELTLKVLRRCVEEDKK